MLLFLTSAGLAGTLSAQTHKRVELPSAAARIRAQIKAEQLLRGGKGIERTLPGPVRDEELVKVLVTPDGESRGVKVRQVLTLGGVGDYFIKVPGPVRDVEPLARSTAQPGLRAGAVVWQGFADKKEVLAAELKLSPQQEAEKLPLAVKVVALVDGAPIESDELPEGRLTLKITLRNSTSSTLSLPSGSPDPQAVANALDALRGVLQRGQMPEPGSDDLPRTLGVSGKVEEAEKTVAAPLRVRLLVQLPKRSTELRANKGQIQKAPGTASITGSLSTRHPGLTFELQARTPGGRLPKIGITAQVAAPEADEVDPPEGTSWRSAVAAGVVSARDMFDKLVFVLAEAAATPEVNGYLGNPDRDGLTSSVYRYEVAFGPRGKAAGPAPSPAPTSESSPLQMISAAALVALLLVVLAVIWARS